MNKRMVIVSFIYSIDGQKKYFGKYIGRLILKDDIKSRVETIVQSLIKDVKSFEIIQESWPDDSVDEFSYTESTRKMYDLFYVELDPPVIYLNGQLIE